MSQSKNIQLQLIKSTGKIHQKEVQIASMINILAKDKSIKQSQTCT